MAAITFQRNVLWNRAVLYRKGSIPLLMSGRSSVTSSTDEDFFARNKAFSRPLSPHLSILIKNPPAHAVLSISHRITGAILGLDISGTTICWLASGKSFSQFIETVQAMSFSPVIVMGAKFCFAFPLTYHFFNAIRHFTWDLGYGFDMKKVNRSGYFILATALLSAICLTIYTP